MDHSKIELCVDQASFPDKLVINNGLSRKTCSADLDLMKQSYYSQCSASLCILYFSDNGE